MISNLFSGKRGEAGKTPNKHRTSQSTATAWDVVVLSFRLLFQRIQFWIRPNIWSVVMSIFVFTGPGAKAALYRTVAAGLRDPGGSEVVVSQEMKKGFQNFFWKALLLAIFRIIALIFIAAALYFWISRPERILQFVSILAFYGFVMWWLTSVYLYPAMVSHPDWTAIHIVKRSIRLAFQKPFESLLFAIVNTLLQIFGIALLGPVMLIIPATRAILSLQAYWFLTGEVIPGFMPVDQYIKSKYSSIER